MVLDLSSGVVKLGQMNTVTFSGSTTNPGWASHDFNRDEYERDLRRRQKEHLDSFNRDHWRPCLHDSCSECVGTGRKRDGTMCVHMLSCPCPKCTPYC